MNYVPGSVHQFKQQFLETQFFLFFIPIPVPSLVSPTLPHSLIHFSERVRPPVSQQRLSNHMRLDQGPLSSI